MRKLIVITGGSKGIGRAIIEKFAANGFDVATCARNKNELDELQSDIGRRFGAQVFTHVADVSLKENVQAFASFVGQLGRRVDVLVNNAGYFVPGEISTEPEGALEKMMDANLFSAYHLTRGLVHKMKDAGAGHIFNMCSIASIKAYANGGSYAITKFALLGFSRCLREELKTTGIRVTSVLPGATRTRSWDGVDLPDDRFMTSEDIAELVYTCHAISPRSVVEELLVRPQLGDI